jgi:hypothetical protein
MSLAKSCGITPELSVTDILIRTRNYKDSHTGSILELISNACDVSLPDDSAPLLSLSEGTVLVKSADTGRHPDGIVEPATYKQAILSPQRDYWIQAMQEELEALFRNGVFTETHLPKGRRALPTMWVFKVKRKPDGSVERFKARLVVKGFMQREGIDYQEVYAPTARTDTFRVLMAVAAELDLEVHHVDVKTAFLNGELDETLFVQSPQGYTLSSDGHALRLDKALYGLKQAPRQWYLKLSSVLKDKGFEPTACDPCLYQATVKGSKAYMLCFVDDIVTVSSKAALPHVKSVILKSFDCRDLGEIDCFLGIKVTRNRAAKTISLSQKAMAEDILHKFGMHSAKPRFTPMDINTKISKAQSEEEVLPTEQYPFGSLVGSLMYLVGCTRPDLANSVHLLARHMSKPTKPAWDAAMQVLKYLVRTKSYCLTYRGGNGTALIGYTDADWAGDQVKRSSTTGYLFLFAGGAVVWNSQLQHSCAASTQEAEYMAASEAAKQADWLKRLLHELGITSGPVRLFIDNQAAELLCENPMLSQRSKHIDIRYHLARHFCLTGVIDLKFVATDLNWSDFLTKPVPKDKFLRCTSESGLADAA